MALRSKKSSLTEKSMRLRDAIKFCSYQDAKGCSSSYSAHRDWSIPQAFLKLKPFCAVFTLKLRFTYKRTPRRSHLRSARGVSFTKA